MDHDAIAEQDFRRAIELDSSFAAPLAALAYTLTQTIYQTHPQDVSTERPTEAIEAATQAIALDPGNALAYCALGRALNNSQQFDRGLDANRKAVELNPCSATSVSSLGYALLYSGNAEAAIPQFERALLLSPRDPETSNFCHGLAM
ncbi:MAG: tetratricopeptide (TPR) repeat protein, partial [Gammaproteobacteria bacterium]